MSLIFKYWMKIDKISCFECTIIKESKSELKSHKTYDEISRKEDKVRMAQDY